MKHERMGIVYKIKERGKGIDRQTDRRRERLRQSGKYFQYMSATSLREETDRQTEGERD